MPDLGVATVSVQRPSVTVNQSAVIMGAVMIAFFVYVTFKGELPIYLGFFVGGAK